MKVIEIQGGFGLENLKLAERPEPTCGPHEVLVKMRAASLNYRDWLMAKGLYNPKQPLPLIPCSDGVGEVTAVGDGVERVKVGDRVASVFAQKWIDGEFNVEARSSTLGGPSDGMLAQFAVLHEDGVTHVPDHLSDEEAATLPCAAVTAWNSLVFQGGLKAGDSVLLLGTGGVSIFALQFATLAGARVIITSKSNEKLEKAKKLGAAEGINYAETPDWDKKVRKLTAGRGVDHVVEVGGADTLPKSINAARFGGNIGIIGVLSGVGTKLALTSVLMKQVRLFGVFVGSRAMFEEMNRAVAAHKMKPVIDRVFDLESAQDAFAYMEAGKHFGKIVIRF
jgi:NADPH:quinone reductase-like Zn-dependent oxidoreductase